MKRLGFFLVLLLFLGGLLFSPGFRSFRWLSPGYWLERSMAASKARRQRDQDSLENPAGAPKTTEPAASAKLTTEGKETAPAKVTTEVEPAASAKAMIEAKAPANATATSETAVPTVLLNVSNDSCPVSPVAGITDPESLAKTAVHDPNAAVRKAAVARLPLSSQEDPVLLERLMLGSDDEKVQDAARKRIPRARQAQFERRMDEFPDLAALARAAVSHPEPAVRHAAVARLQDPAALAQVAVEAPDFGVRRAAAARIPRSAVRDPLLARLSAVSPPTGQEISVSLDDLTTMPLLWVPPTSSRGFLMGSPENEKGRKPREKRHAVVLTRGFWLGRTEVTLDQWCAVMGHYCGRSAADHPVANVSWDEAMEYCRKLTETERAARRLPEGYEYTLPTEAQWEYACRAGTTGAYAGDLDAMAWYDLGESGEVHAVATKRPNAWGFFDMHGNLYEWCRDWWADDLPEGEVIDPLGPTAGKFRVYRGGCWWFGADACRSAKGNGDRPGAANNRVGFRLALAPQPGLAPASVRPPDVAEAATEPVSSVAAVPPRQDSPREPLLGDPPSGVRRSGEVMTVRFGEKASVVLCWVEPTGGDGFQMGAYADDKHREDDQKLHPVILTRGFWLGQTEVTQALWVALMGSNPSGFKGDNLPVETVSWDDAMAFCRKLTARERAAGRLSEAYQFTLQTEAQWEFACRSGSRGHFAGESDGLSGGASWNVAEVAWYERNADQQTHPVGKKRPNYWGLHDMHGNVAEWCRDWYGEYPGGLVTDPTGPSSGRDRVYRGGSWRLDAKGCVSANRMQMAPSFRDSTIGFRLALVTETYEELAAESQAIPSAEVPRETPEPVRSATSAKTPVALHLEFVQPFRTETERRIEPQGLAVFFVEADGWLRENRAAL